MFGSGRLLLFCTLPLLLALLLPPAAQAASADDPQFELKPKSCIAMSKGKDCYGDLVLSWKLYSPRNVCLYLEGRERPIYCWTKRLAGDYSGPFILSKSGQYTLVDVETKEVLFSDSITVTWVYKESRKRRRWRLF